MTIGEFINYLFYLEKINIQKIYFLHKHRKVNFL